MIDAKLISVLLSYTNLAVLAGILIGAFIIIDSVFGSYREFADWLYYIFRKKVRITPELEQETREYLKEIHYFNQLSETGKERFINRVLYIIPKLNFSATGYQELTFRNEVLLASSLVQLTFGLKNYYLHTIEHIKIFKGQIMNPRTKQRFYGLMFTSGKMYLSWEKFLEGIETHDDGINLGIHEASHGLLILLKHHKLNYDEFDAIISKWYEKAQPFIISEDRPDAFFRKYAAANKDEFFSVMMENFFERPAEFKRLMPDIYDEVCVFLYQDPSNTSNDFRISGKQMNIAEGMSLSAIRPLNLVQDKWHWSFTAIILGSYFAYVFNLIVKNFLASSFTDIFVCYIIIIPIVFILLRKHFVDGAA